MPVLDYLFNASKLNSPIREFISNHIFYWGINFDNFDSYCELLHNKIRQYYELVIKLDDIQCFISLIMLMIRTEENTKVKEMQKYFPGRSFSALRKSLCFIEEIKGLFQLDNVIIPNRITTLLKDTRAARFINTSNENNMVILCFNLLRCVLTLGYGITKLNSGNSKEYYESEFLKQGFFCKDIISFLGGLLADDQLANRTKVEEEVDFLLGELETKMILC